MTDSRKKALVVDDNTNNLMLEKDLMESAGYEVFEATDATTGIAIARREKPDIILMDVRMPDMRGSEAAKILRLDPETHNIPIVFVTASVMADGRAEIEAIPNTGFISKPINTRTFAKEIGQFMMEEKPAILVVDDQYQNLELLEARLVPEGYRIIKASSGEEALRKLSSHRIDLVLLDVMMPGLDGFEVTRRIRADGSFRLLPVILITALTETEDRIKGIQSGCDDFISKPVDKMELLARVRSLLKVKAYHDLMTNYRTELESEVKKRTGELKHALEHLKSASLETIYRLSMAAEHRDEDTGCHVQRMSRYSAAIARRLGLDEKAVETILYATPMHDLGKIGIPDRILLKPDKLDPSEWEIMKQHTIIGANILKGSNASFIQMGELIALTHHERWDGTGYPNGLKGTDIPIASRIAAAADVFDALTSRRPYKEPFTVEKSWQIIREGRGTHFDPQVVDAFLSIPEEILSIKRHFADDGSQVPDGSEVQIPSSKGLCTVPPGRVATSASRPGAVAGTHHGLAEITP